VAEPADPLAPPPMEHALRPCHGVSRNPPRRSRLRAAHADGGRRPHAGAEADAVDPRAPPPIEHALPPCQLASGRGARIPPRRSRPRAGARRGGAGERRR